MRSDLSASYLPNSSFLGFISANERTRFLLRECLSDEFSFKSSYTLKELSFFGGKIAENQLCGTHPQCAPKFKHVIRARKPVVSLSEARVEQTPDKRELSSVVGNAEHVVLTEFTTVSHSFGAGSDKPYHFL